MAIQTKKSGTSPLDGIDLPQFTADFFAVFGATVTRLKPQKQDVLAVQLTPELAAHFDRPALQLVFHQEALAAGRDLVSPGSCIFDRMLAYLEQRGALTVQRLPNCFPGSEELLQAVRPVNMGITGLQMQEQIQHLFAFHWRITYRADDKREEIYTVVLDESGARLAQPGDMDTVKPGANLEKLLADAQPVPPEKNAEGQPIPPKLPPMTALSHLAETARKYAIYHADLNCVSLEAEILPRLYKALNRLTNYYQQQMEETYDAHDPTGEKRQALEADLQRKIQEEVENHRLRIKVELISYAVLQVPVATADITLSDGERDILVRVRRNRYSGVLRRPTCYACDQETTTIAIDRNGHITCDNCTQQCAACQAIICANCGVEPCPACGKQHCETCGLACWVCGERACSEHISTCPVCGDAVCHACQTACVHCGIRQCRSHLRADHVTAGQGQTALICATCAVRCAGCQQYSVQIGLCSASGQRYCLACLATCNTCGQSFGPGFFQTVGQAIYCRNCLVVCSHCSQLTPETAVCTQCGDACCASCGRTCAVCHEMYCSQHAQQNLHCEHALCATHVGQCSQCANAVCPLCRPACGICMRAFCDDHATTCQQCGGVYCRECIRRSGLCDTCAMAPLEGVLANPSGEPWAADPHVAGLLRHYRWMRIQNNRYVVYVGDGAVSHRMVITLDQYSSDQAPLMVRRVSRFDELIGRLWR